MVTPEDKNATRRMARRDYGYWLEKARHTHLDIDYKHSAVVRMTDAMEGIVAEALRGCVSRDSQVPDVWETRPELPLQRRAEEPPVRVVPLQQWLMGQREYLGETLVGAVLEVLP